MDLEVRITLSLCVMGLFFGNGCASKLPSIFTPCHLSDPDINTCMKNAAQIGFTMLGKGVPEIGLKPFEPYKVGDVKRNFGGILQFDFYDIKIYGITNTTMIYFKWNPKKKNIKFKTVNTGHMKAKYKADGRLVIIPIQGDGDCFFKLINVAYNYTIPYDVVKGADGKDYWKFKQHRFSYYPDKVEFQFTNLFNGNTFLADQVIRFANDNWRDILSEVGGPLMTTFIDGLIGQIGTVFSNIPVEDFLLP